MWSCGYTLVVVLDINTLTVKNDIIFTISITEKTKNKSQVGIEQTRQTMQFCNGLCATRTAQDEHQIEERMFVVARDTHRSIHPWEASGGVYIHKTKSHACYYMLARYGYIFKNKHANKGEKENMPASGQ